MSDKTKNKIQPIAELKTLRKQKKEIHEQNSENKERYKLIIENIPTVVWTTNQKGETVFISSNIKEVYGYTPEEIYEGGSELWLNRIHPEDVNKVKRSYAAIFSKKKEFDAEYRIRRKDGRWIWLHDRASVTKQKGNMEYAYGVFSDITDRKNVEASLLKEKAFTDMALNAQSDTFFLFELATGKALRWNQSFKDITGYKDHEIEIMPAPESYYSQGDLEKATSFIEKVLLDGVGTIELELICKNGNRVPTEYRVSVINDNLGKPMYMISIGRDISERKRIENEIKKYRHQLEGLVKERTTELENANAELKKKNAELERFHDATVDREFRINELNTQLEEIKNRMKE